MNRVRHLMRKEFLELRQDPRLFGIVIIAPILQLTMLGYAATTDVKDVPVVVVDEEDASSASRVAPGLVNPVTGKKIVVKDGRFGPYVKHGDEFRSLESDEDVFTISLDGALTLLLRMVRRNSRSPFAVVLTALTAGFGVVISHHQGGSSHAQAGTTWVTTMHHGLSLAAAAHGPSPTAGP